MAALKGPGALPSMSDATRSDATIESILQEQRVFQPPAALAATARIGSMAA